MKRPELLLVSLGLLVSACAAGPDYEQPEDTLPETFVNAGEAASEDGQPVSGLWASLGEPELIRLIDAALENNTTILQALATLVLGLLACSVDMTHIQCSTRRQWQDKTDFRVK